MPKSKTDMDHPPCPECGTNVLVHQFPNTVYFCYSCQNTFNEQGEITDERKAPKSYLKKGNPENSRVHTLKVKHMKLLERLQNWERNYFNATNVVNHFDAYTQKNSVGYLFGTLHEHELITTWGSGNSKRTWYLTDKGQNATHKDLL